MSNGVVLYGAPSGPWPEPERPERLPFTQPARDIVVPDLLATLAPHRVRVCVLVEDDGRVKLKVLCDDRLIAEVEGTRSLTLETQIGGVP